MADGFIQNFDWISCSNNVKLEPCIKFIKARWYPILSYQNFIALIGAWDQNQKIVYIFMFVLIYPIDYIMCVVYRRI